jgi:ribosomal protein L29
MSGSERTERLQRKVDELSQQMRQAVERPGTVPDRLAPMRKHELEREVMRLEGELAELRTAIACQLLGGSGGMVAQLRAIAHKYGITLHEIPGYVQPGA